MSSTNLTYEFPRLSPATRIRELILYISEKSKNDPKFGRTKLAKIIYFADIESYRTFGIPVTGSAYARFQYGPLPVNFHDVLNDLEKTGQIKTHVSWYKTQPQKRVLAQEEPDLSAFSDQDIEIVDKMILQLLPYNASDVTELSHGIAWEQTDEKERIPYEASLLSDEPLTPEEISFGLKLAREHDFGKIQD